MAEKKPKSAGCCWEDHCERGSIEITPEKCLYFAPMQGGGYDWSRNYCIEEMNATIAEWSNWGEYIAFKTAHIEEFLSNDHGIRDAEYHWIGAGARHGGVWRWDSNGKIAFTEQDEKYWYDGAQCGSMCGIPNPDPNIPCVVMQTFDNWVENLWDETSLVLAGFNGHCDALTADGSIHSGASIKPLCQRYK